jgi:hypothetical protein
MTKQMIMALLVGTITGATLVTILLQILTSTHAHHHDHHPIADPAADEYHVHADFHIVIDDTLVDLSGDAFQTTSQQELHDHLHLHDNNGDVLHIHAENYSFTSFLESLGINLTDQCITLDNEYCANDTSVLQLYVNNEPFTKPIADYIPSDDDRILVYYGSDDPEAITEYLNAVPADSCFYSGTCPERGTAPPESCGLTCEL